MSRLWTTSDLAEKIAAYVEAQYGDWQDYAARNPQEISSSRATMSFTFDDAGPPIPGQALIEIWSDAHVVTLMLMHIPMDQYSKNRKILKAMVDSLEVTPADPQWENGMQALQQYEHPAGDAGHQGQPGG